MIPRLKSLLRRHEGLRLQTYLCPAGFETVGYGHRLLPWEHFDDITEEEAEELLDGDVNKALKRCQLFIPHWNLLNEVRQIVLCSMVFQMGIGTPGKTGVLGFTRMIAALREQDYWAAADCMLDSKWARKDSPRRARELAEMMRTGEWPAETVQNGTRPETQNA